MAEPQVERAKILVVRDDQPLFAVPMEENGENVTWYFTDEEAFEAAAPPQSIQEALSLAGAWSNLDWDEMEEALDRIRHSNRPTPPIDEL